MELIPDSEMAEEDTRNTKKRYMVTDAICLKCGIIFNSYWEDQCVICYDIEKDREYICDHRDFIVGKQSVGLRKLLDYHLEELRVLCDIHGLSLRSRPEMAYDLMKKMHSSLDKRITIEVIRKVIIRNRKRFWYVQDIDDAIHKIRRSNIRLLNKEECIEEKMVKADRKRIEDDKCLNLKVAKMVQAKIDKDKIMKR